MRASARALSLAVALALVGACGGGSKPPPKSSSTDDAFEAAVAAEKEQDKARAAAAAPTPLPAEARAAREASAEANKKEAFPAPFTWEEIRAATKPGRTYRYKVEVRGKPAKERVVTFVKVDADGCEIFAGGDAPRRKGWPSLQKDTEFPKDKVNAREETVKLPAGKFDCMVYEVTGNDGEVTTYYFARTLPGAPVLFYTDVDGRRMKTTTLLQHIPGKDS